MEKLLGFGSSKMAKEMWKCVVLTTFLGYLDGKE